MSKHHSRQPFGNNINAETTRGEDRSELPASAESETTPAPKDVANTESSEEMVARLAEKEQENASAPLPDSAAIKDETIGNADKAPETIELLNKNRFPTLVHSVTGDSLQLPPGKHTVPGHFNWNLPEGVTISKE